MIHDEIGGEADLDAEIPEKEVVPKPPIRQAVDAFYQVQEHRIAVSLQRMAEEKRGGDAKFLQELEDRLRLDEAFILKYVKSRVQKDPSWKWLKEVKGVGPLIAGSLLSQLDPARAPHASCYWAACGLSVDKETGQAVRRKKGEKISWNPFLKTTVWKLGCSFVKKKGEYRSIYDSSKAFYRAKFPEKVLAGKTKDGKEWYRYSDGHVHAMAMRRTVKLFLARLWEVQRRNAGLDVSVPYAERIGVHVPRT